MAFLVLAPYGQNYWFVPDAKSQVSYCVVDCDDDREAWVISTQYGGCEYHELYNAQLNLLAFLHVYRGDGITVQYTPATGWVERSVKRSAKIAQKHGMGGSNWSVSRVDRKASPPTVQSEFVHVKGFPGVTVRGVDDGDTPYT